MKYCTQCEKQYGDDVRLCLEDGTFLSFKDPYNLVGRLLAGKYRLDALAGIGGMGAVYSAHQVGPERRVAVKILLPNLAMRNKQALEFFEREAKMAGQFLHENVAIIFDAGRTSDDIAYISMEWLEGHTLEEEISQGVLSLDRASHILRQIAAGLDAAHSMNIIHRDLKPSNIMLVKRPDGQERIKILDFGIGKVLTNTFGSSVSGPMGTPHYASPEQVRTGGNIDKRTDIYSLGVILYEMLTGLLPFNAPSMYELMRMQQATLPIALCRMRPDAPAAIEQLIARMLSYDPTLRPKSALEVAMLFGSAVENAQQKPSDSEIVSIKTTRNIEPAVTDRTQVNDLHSTISPSTTSLNLENKNNESLYSWANRQWWTRLLAQVLGALLMLVISVYILRKNVQDEPNQSGGNEGVKLSQPGPFTPFLGGRFEASGAVWIPDTNLVLMVDDGRYGEILLMTLDEDGQQAGPISSLKLGVQILDPESITYDGAAWFYIVSSHSDPGQSTRSGLLRFAFDRESRTVRGTPELVPDLGNHLLSLMPELKAEGEQPGSRGGINIEGLTYDPDNGRLLVGLRSPLMGGHAVIVPLKLKDPLAPLTRENLVVDEKRIFLINLGGQGIRDLDYIPQLKTFLIISGAIELLEKNDFGLWEWSGGTDKYKPEDPPRFKTRLDAGANPEGITNVTINGKNFLLIVGDRSKYLKLDY